MGSPGRRSDVNKGVLFWTELIQAERDRDDIECHFRCTAKHHIQILSSIGLSVLSESDSLSFCISAHLLATVACLCVCSRAR